jgi:hypothetical protein
MAPHETCAAGDENAFAHENPSSSIDVKWDSTIRGLSRASQLLTASTHGGFSVSPVCYHHSGGDPVCGTKSRESA